MEILTKKKKMRVCVGGGGSIPVYKDVEVLDKYKALVLAQHPDGQCGIYIDDGTDVLQASRYNFGETPGDPPREVKVTNETHARAEWDKIVDDLKLKDAEKEQREASLAAVKKARETAAAVRDMKIKKIVQAKHEALDNLKEYVSRPGVDLFGKKTAELCDAVIRCETILKYL